MADGSSTRITTGQWVEHLLDHNRPMGRALARSQQANGSSTRITTLPFSNNICALPAPGDVSYATIDPPNNEVEWTWDAFNTQIEPFASTAPVSARGGNTCLARLLFIALHPFCILYARTTTITRSLAHFVHHLSKRAPPPLSQYMAVPGNHENVPGTLIPPPPAAPYAADFAAFSARYTMPGPQSGGNASMFFSYDYKNAHYLAVCTELDYTPGSQQYTFVQSDLAAAVARRATVPWIIVMLHRPVLSADTSEFNAHCPGAPLAAALGPLFNTAGVDLVLQGHEHCYERSAAVDVVTGNISTLPSGTPDNAVYTNPGAPIYIVQGTAGADQRETFETPTPAWSLVATNNVYGFGRMTINGTSRLFYEFVDTDGFVHDTFTIVKTA